MASAVLFAGWIIPLTLLLGIIVLCAWGIIAGRGR